MLNESFFFLTYLIKPKGKPSQETKTPKPNIPSARSLLGR